MCVRCARAWALAVILVDSSVWIDLLRDVQTAQTLALRELLPRREAALTAVVYQEILQGAATRIDEAGEVMARIEQTGE